MTLGGDDAKLDLQMEPQLLRETIADVLQSQCALDVVQRHAAGTSTLDASVRMLAGQLGWAGLCIASEQGGLDLQLDALAVLGEEGGRTLAPGCLATMSLAAAVLARFAPDEVRDRLLPQALSGELAVCIDAELLTSEPKPNRLVLGPANAKLLLLAFKDDNATLQLGLAEVKETAALKSVNLWDQTREMSLLTTENLLITPLVQEAYAYACQAMAILIAADSIGAWQTIVEQTIEYLGVREQFGRKLGSFQALKHRLADLHVGRRLSQARLAATCEVQTSQGNNALAWALLCKAEATDGASFAAGECLQLHGGIGFTWEHHSHLFLKRARLNQALIGDNDMLRSSMGMQLVRTLASDGVRDELEYATS